jgi:RNA polymerase sigma factor (sigma-70 family)
VEERLNEWFVQNILVHERALMRFLARVWPDRSEVDDLRHEAYVKVLESAARSLPLSPRAFLFATLRHLMVDRVRRGKIVSIEFQEDLDSLNVLIDEASPERLVGARQDLWELARAFEELPPSCRDIMWMVKVEELTQRQIADRLNLTVRAVEKRIAVGLKLLREGCLCQSQAARGALEHTGVKGESGHG